MHLRTQYTECMYRYNVYTITWLNKQQERGYVNTHTENAHRTRKANISFNQNAFFLRKYKGHKLSETYV